MSSATTTSLNSPIILHLGPVLARLSESDFYEFCQLNRDLRIERTENGDLIIMAPTGGNTGWRNLALSSQLWNWCDRDGTGIGFDSSTGFLLPNGAKRSPDASWVLRERWDALSDEQQEEFPPLAPDFVMELLSKHDALEELRSKMREYIANGVRLGWLIDRFSQRVEVYRAGQGPVTLDHPTMVNGDPELPGFVLDLTQIW